jgi:hypothetical protein
MPAFHQIERIESRVLGALRCVDAATGIPVAAPLAVDVPADTRIMRNRGGFYLISRCGALPGHDEAFSAPPVLPPLASVTLLVTVRDPAGIYLARSAEIRLPRDARPENAATPDSLFNPVDVELYRSPAAPLGANWVAVRVSLRETDTRDALGGAVVRVRNNGRILARGQSDWRGEAAVPVVGVPITTWSEDESAVTVTAIDATLEVFFDAAAGSIRTPAAAVAAGRQPADAPACNTAAAESNPAAVRTQAAIRLVAGQTLPLSITLDLPG